MSEPAVLAADNAREGALDNLSPALGACAVRGENGRGGFRGRGGGHHKMLEQRDIL